jgi:NADH-quinone oxidoreductase subunit H
MEEFIDVGLVVLKAALAMGAVLQLASLTTWVERKASALIQNRVGANRAAILGFDLAGLINTLVADPIKALTKEDFVPKGVSQFMHSLAPFMGVFPVLLSFAVLPFGPPLEMGGVIDLPFLEPFEIKKRVVSLQVADLNIGVLYVLAMGSLAVYGTVLAGWVSNNKFSLLGSLRASAQMISYEITMGLSIVGVLALYQTLDFAEIVNQQSGTVLGFLPKWGIFMSPFNLIAFVLFFTSAMAETKRAPFDLPESESELVAGYMTEYSGMKFLLFWLGEFAEIVVAAALVTVIFFGGWQLPWVDISSWGWQGSLLGAMVFGAKVSFFCVLQVVIRWTVPRFRYDQLLNLCWKIMLPIALANLVFTIAFMLWLDG